jgi:NTP pyrophosphatase (non-canonical NTP hydrolase)
MQDTIERIRKFRDDRDWRQFHNPKDLAASISIEAAELLELFQWKNAEQSARFAAENSERVSEDNPHHPNKHNHHPQITGIDLAQAIDAKLEKNAKKYPVEKSRGQSTKYTDL